MTMRIACLLVILGLLTILTTPLCATVLVNGVVDWAPISGTSPATSNPTATGYGDGLDKTVPSAFNNNWVVVPTDSTASSAPTALSAIPVVFSYHNNLNNFVFVLDTQEVQGAGREALQIDSITLTVNGTLIVWQSAEPILLNSTAPFTNTPLGNGGDMALLIPVRYFDGLNLTGSSTLVFTVTMSLGNNGSDEWQLNSLVYPNMFFYNPNDPIDSTVPEPSSFVLTLVGIGLASLAVARKRTAN